MTLQFGVIKWGSVVNRNVNCVFFEGNLAILCQSEIFSCKSKSLVTVNLCRCVCVCVCECRQSFFAKVMKVFEAQTAPVRRCVAVTYVATWLIQVSIKLEWILKGQVFCTSLHYSAILIKWISFIISPTPWLNVSYLPSADGCCFPEQQSQRLFVK